MSDPRPPRKDEFQACIAPGLRFSFIFYLRGSNFFEIAVLLSRTIHEGKLMNRSLLLEFKDSGLLPLNEVLSLIAAGKLRGRPARLALRGAQLEAEAEKLLDGSEERQALLDEAAKIEDIFLTAAARL
jgi:hypothetical protein